MHIYIDWVALINIVGVEVGFGLGIGLGQVRVRVRNSSV